MRNQSHCDLSETAEAGDWDSTIGSAWMASGGECVTSLQEPRFTIKLIADLRPT